MSSRAWILRLLGVFALGCLARTSLGREGSLYLTVYGNDLAVVRERREVLLARGISRVVFGQLPVRVDPSSFRVRFLSEAAPVKVLEYAYRPPIGGREELLAQLVGRPVQIVTEEGVISGTLRAMLGAEPVILSQDQGITIVSASTIRRVILPSDVELVSEPGLVLEIESESQGRQACELQYLTSGLSWEAYYTLVLNEAETQLDLEGCAKLENHSGRKYENACLSLVAGQIHVAAKETPRPLFRVAETAMAAAPEAPEERPVFEYHVYEFSRPVTLEDGQIKDVPLVSASRAGCKKHYVYDGQRDGSQVRVQIRFRNDKPSGPGQPLPAGTVRIYKQDRDRLRLVGEDRLGHTPVGADVQLTAGYAFDIEGKRTLVESRQMAPGAREESYRIELSNRKDQAVQVEIHEHLWGDWEIRHSTEPFVKKSATEIQFVVDVAPRSSKSVEYRALIRQ